MAPSIAPERESSAASASLRRCLGPLEVTAQAIATIGLTLTAVINIPEAMRSAGRGTWISYAIALVAVLLVCETLVLFRRLPPGPRGIAAYVEAGLGARASLLASWTLLLGYGAAFLACLAFLGFYLDRLLVHLGLPGLGVGGFLLGGLACLLLARRDVRLSTGTMLLTESLSVLIVLVLTLLVLRQGGPAQDLRAIDPIGDTRGQVSSGLMVAVLSFIGFESAANLGAEALHPQRVVPRAMRLAVIAAGLLFVLWAVALPEGLGWLPASQRYGLDAVSELADRLGQHGAGLWIRFGTFLCLFGSSLGALNAMGRLAFSLAGARLLPRSLALVDSRAGAPARALSAVALPVIAGGALPVARGLSASQLFDRFGGFAVLAFLLVYGLVALSSLRTPLPGPSARRRWLVGGSCLLAVSAIAIAYLAGVIAQQGPMLLTFAALLLLGVLRLLWLGPAQPAGS